MSEPSNNQHENTERQTPQQGHEQAPQGSGSTQQSPGGQPPKKSKKKWLLGCGIALLAGLIILIVVIVLIVQGLGGSDDTTSGTEPADSSTSSSAPATGSSASGKPVAINQIAKVGNFDVKVLSTSKAKTVGGDGLEEKAQGEFLIVKLQVKNNDSAVGYFGDEAVKAITQDGDQIEASLEASTTLDDGLSIQEINPGKRVTGKTVFDIPNGQQVKSLEISDPDLLGDEIQEFSIK